MKVTAQCIGCKATRSFGPGDVARGDHPLCNACYMPMIAVSASASPSPSPKTRNTFAVYAVGSNGKPGGFVGRYRTRDEASGCDFARRNGARIKRERVSAEEWARWEAAGFPARLFGGAR